MLRALSDAPAGLTTPQLAELAGGASSWVNALGTTRVLMLKQQARGRVEQAGTVAGNLTRESVLWRITDEGRRYVQAAAGGNGSVTTQPRPRQEVTEADMRWITAYLQYLPKDRAGFSKLKREHWLDAIRVALDLIYEASDEERTA